MLDLAQTLAILKLLDDKKPKSSDKDEGEIFYFFLGLIFLPILFFIFPIIYLFIYCPYKLLTRNKFNNYQQINNITFVKYLIAALIYSSLLILYLAKVLPLDLAFTLFIFIFYILYIINILIDFIDIIWVKDST